ncbi:hypothetical protein BGW39_008591 [Mortierella sp. 14UC]|nr:hypothetical protein BGW39_008591 [Mortierella sp. 14UC]
MVPTAWRYSPISFQPLPLNDGPMADDIINFPDPDEVVPISPLPFEFNLDGLELDPPEPFELDPLEPFELDPAPLVIHPAPAEVEAEPFGNDLDPFDIGFEPFDVETEPFLEEFGLTPVFKLMPQPAQILALLPQNSIAASLTVALVVAFVAVVVFIGGAGM